MKHFLSDSGIWKVMAEFVDANGRVMLSEGEVVNAVSKDEIVTDVWVASENVNRRNTYKISEPSASGEGMTARSTNPELPSITGTYNIDKNNLHFKFRMEGSDVNGYQLTTRKGNTCYAYGAQYQGDKLLVTWTATLNKKEAI
jgi:hypothetical protein